MGVRFQQNASSKLSPTCAGYTNGSIAMAMESKTHTSYVVMSITLTIVIPIVETFT